jgi:hypothetical protein
MIQLSRYVLASIYIFFQQEGAILLDILKPRFSSSLYSWHRSQVSQQKWTQQSKQGDSCKLYCARIEERLLQVYSHWHPTDSSNTYRAPFMQQAGSKDGRSVKEIGSFCACIEEILGSKTRTCGASVHNLCNAAKCVRGAPASQATCTIEERMKHVLFRNTCAGSVRSEEQRSLHTGANISEASKKPD